MLISIDGASRRNGQPNCIAAGGVFVEHNGAFRTAASYKDEASNQQGELLGMITALTVALKERNTTIYIVTDSEYVYNAITKDWIGNWKNKGWLTADNNPVKSQGLWEEIAQLQQSHVDADNEIMMYHIKGHLVSIGKVGAAKLLKDDPTGYELYKAAWSKYTLAEEKSPDKFINARELFKRNHGFVLPPEQFKQFVVMNTVADYVAGTYLDMIDSGGA